MPHENDLLDSRECRPDRHAGALPAHGTLPGRAADAAAQDHQSPRDGGARSALETGGAFLAHSDGEEIQITQVTRDFVHWINPVTDSTGRMLRAHFLNFFTPISPPN
jgi:hypothetical protein